MLRPDKMARVYMAVIATIGWFGLVLQFPLSIALSREKGMSIGGAVLIYFSFFTILTNILVALGLTCCLCMPSTKWGRFCARMTVKSGLALYIGVVGAVYSLVLRQLWNPEGLQKIADMLLHDVVPVLYVLYWFVFVHKTPLPWKSVLFWLIYPLAYLFYTLIHGALSGWYPYPFMDAGSLGYGRVFSNSLALLAAFLVFSLAMVGFTRWVGRNFSEETRIVDVQ